MIGEYSEQNKAVSLKKIQENKSLCILIIIHLELYCKIDLISYFPPCSLCSRDLVSLLFLIHGRQALPYDHCSTCTLCLECSLSDTWKAKPTLLSSLCSNVIFMMKPILPYLILSLAPNHSSPSPLILLYFSLFP